MAASATAALLALSACGRVGFDALGDAGAGDRDGTAADGDAVGTGDAAPACVGSAFPVSASVTDSIAPDAAWNGSQVGVVWKEGTTTPGPVRFRTATLAGALGTEVPLGDASAFDIGADGASFRTAHAADGGSGTDIFWSSDGATPGAVTSDPQGDSGPELAITSAGAAAILWRHAGGGSTVELHVAVIDSTGAVAAGPTPIVTGTQVSLQSEWALAWNGSELAAFYSQSGNLYLQRIDASATPIGAPIVFVAESTFSLAARWAGDRYLVAWFAAGQVSTAYVAADGSLMSPITRVASSAITLDLQIAIGASTDLVVWRDSDRSILMPMARDGTPGTIATVPNASVSPVWVDTTFALAVSRGTMPRDIELLTLCP